MRLYLSSFHIGNKPEELLGLLGSRRRTGYIVNAVDGLPADFRRKSITQERDRLKSIGLEPEELDLRKYFGNPEATKAALSGFDLIWVRGGNSFVLRRALKQSGADKIITRLLVNDSIVYGGYSAGAVVMGPHLRGIELVDPKNEVPAGYDKAVVWEGLGLLLCGIAPHYKSDHPESAAIEKVVDYYITHHIPFVALRDGEAMVVHGNEQKVVG